MATKKRPAPVKKVASLAELRTLAESDERYRRLAVVAAQNLGGEARDLDAAMRWLSTNAAETDSEEGGGEAGVVAEVNFCRDLV